MHGSMADTSRRDVSASPNEVRPDRARRLQSVDFLRGVALTIVLLDHIDWIAGSMVFRKWTLVGLGFSDAADVFVFLSGFTFGWVYTPRLQQKGLWECEKRASMRALQIYIGYLFTAAAVGLIAVIATRALSLGHPHFDSVSRDGLIEALERVAFLDYRPFSALGILCLYMVVLPLMPVLLLIARHWCWLSIGISAAVYVTAQPPLNWELPGLTGAPPWFFNPFAWQILLVLGMICGHLASRRSTDVSAGQSSGETGVPAPNARSSDSSSLTRWMRDGSSSRAAAALALLLALAVVLFGLLAVKIAPNWPERIAGVSIKSNLNEVRHNWLTAKSHLGPLRLLHFAALAYVLALTLPRRETLWSHWSAHPFILCGRYSLTIYCIGTVIMYICYLVFAWTGTAPLAVILIGLDAVIVQCLAAAFLNRHARLDRRSRLG